MLYCYNHSSGRATTFEAAFSFKTHLVVSLMWSLGEVMLGEMSRNPFYLGLSLLLETIFVIVWGTAVFH